MPNPPPAANLEWTVLKVLQWAAPYLKERGIDSPRATAEILLAHALHTERVQLYMHHDQPLEKTELAAFKELLRRRLRREPVAYIVGRKGFWTLELKVTPEVLIPRPETECLVEAALAALSGLSERPHGPGPRPGDRLRRHRARARGRGAGASLLRLRPLAGGDAPSPAATPRRRGSPITCFSGRPTGSRLCNRCGPSST